MSTSSRSQFTRTWSQGNRTTMSTHSQLTTLALPRRALLVGGIAIAPLVAMPPSTAGAKHNVSGIPETEIPNAPARIEATERPDSGAIRPFRVHVPDDALADLRRRIAATRWPDKETVSDPSQGAQLEKLQALVHYWGTDYDWRKVEAALDALPQFTTNIDG